MHRLILDTDLAMGAPGSDVDDGFALALALDLPDLRVELITTVNGTGRPFASYAGRCAHAWIDFLAEAYPLQNLLSAPMHDALAVAVISDPDPVTWQPAQVQVESASRLARGVTVAGLLTSADAPPPNCHIATRVDTGAFLELFLKHLAQL